MLNNNQPRSEAQFEAKSEAPSKLSTRATRREHSRYRVDLDVTMGSDHNFYAGFAENLSTGGLFIATHTMRKVGEILDISVNLPNSPTPIKGVGEVRWVREFSETSNVPPGLGLRFIRLEPGCTEIIQDFLANREPLFYDDEE